MKHPFWHWLFERVDGTVTDEVQEHGKAAVITRIRLFNRCTLCGHRRVAHEWRA